MTQQRTRMSRIDQQAQTRQSLISAAAEVFGERGFGAATIEQITAAAGYTRGAFYANFASKHELLEAVLSQRDQDDRTQLRALLDQGDSLNREELVAWLTRVVRVEAADSQQRLEIHLHALREGGQFARQLRTHNEQERSEVREMIASFAGADAGLTDVFLSVLDGLVLRTSLMPELDVERVWRDLLDVTLPDGA